MKELKNITLERNCCIQSYSIRNGKLKETFLYAFLFPLSDVKVPVSAYPNDDIWEHVMINLISQQRCPTYEEMCKLKENFWKQNEITLQVHPAKSEYVNFCEYALHLWRYKNISQNAENRLFRKINQIYQEAKQYYQGKNDVLLLDGDIKKVVIFGGTSWPTWEEVCQIKQNYWNMEEAAVQFNICPEFDMNDEHMIILWDATDFELPPKELV